MKQISFFIPLLGTLLLSGCAGTSTEFECNATTSDTCMTMEQANEKAKKLERSSEAKPVAASLPRLAEGNFRTMPVQTVTATTPSGSRPAVTAHPEQKLLAPRPLFTAAREVKTVVPVSSVAPVTPPRPLRTGEQTAALWIAPYIDNAWLTAPADRNILFNTPIADRWREAAKLIGIDIVTMPAAAGHA